VRAPPHLRGGLPSRLASLVLGLFLFAAGIVAFLESGLGLPPWDVLHQGLVEHTALSFGAANIVVGLAVLALAWALGASVGIGTVANAILVGVFVSLLTALDAVSRLADEPLGARLALLGTGLVLVGSGSALYLGAGLGAGPRDSLMVVGSHRTGVRIGVVRTAIELAALGLGFSLGGTAGIGTLAFGLLIGPSVEWSFWLLERSGLARRPEQAAALGT